jgi:hypothetical protein
VEGKNGKLREGQREKKEALLTFEFFCIQKHEIIIDKEKRKSSTVQ